MKRWIIIAVVLGSVIAIGLLAASVFAYTSSPQYRAYSTVSAPGYSGGMVGSGYSPNSGYSTPNGYSQPFAARPGGYGRCMGALGWP
jgi:hypothetical protein